MIRPPPRLSIIINSLYSIKIKIYKKKFSLDLSKQQNFTFKVFVYLSFAIWILKYFITKMQNWSFLNRNILGAFSSSFQIGLSKIWFTLQREKRGRTSSTASFRPIMHERSKPTSRNHDYRIICITPTECGHRGTSTAMSVHNTIEMNADFKQAEYQARATERTNERIRSESFEKVTITFFPPLFVKCKYNKINTLFEYALKGSFESNFSSN